MMLKKLDKKFLLCLIVIAAAVLICIGVVYYLSRTEIKEEPKEETLIERQLRELDELRENTPPLTEEEIQEQSRKLDQLRGENQPLSEEEIQEQLKELDKLHQDSQ